MRISILINNYNYRAFVGRAIESALNQRHADVEVIVVDDGSTDGSQDVIDGYGDRVLAVMQRNGGQGAAYNSGFALATGDVVIFLDADDWLYPEATERIAAAWRPGVSKLQFLLDMVDVHGVPLGRSVPRHLHDGDALALLASFGAYGSPPGSGNAYAAAFLRCELPLDAFAWRTAADSVSILLAPAYGEIVSLAQPLGAYRLHRQADAGGFLFNNAPLGLWHEYARLVRSKRFVAGALARLGVPHRETLLLAPWEVRIAALCVRFGGMPDGVTEPTAPRALVAHALRSVWRWPAARWPFKLALSAWLLGVWLLPEPVALRMARLHKTSIGATHAA